MMCLDKKNAVVIYGQSDYVARIKAYFELDSPDSNLILVSFSLDTDKPGQTKFDFSLCDSVLRGMNSDVMIIVAFSSKDNEIARQHLNSWGFTNIVLYNSAMDNDMKRRYFKKYFSEKNVPFLFWDDYIPKKTVKVYMAKCVSDKTTSLSSADYESSYIIPIQVGAALTDQRITQILDSTGDNISIRNRHYSEMTAFYWMWKNDVVTDYLGICHYRRLWVDLDKIVGKLQSTDIDAVLPLPTLCEHSVHEDYLLKHIPAVWQPMMEVMKKQSLEYYNAAQEIFRGKIFYASNMCILRRKVLNDLCEWMFPIVMEVEKMVGDIKDPYYNRYAGFCTERLITLYFLYNKHRWKIAHAEKVFIG